MIHRYQFKVTSILLKACKTKDILEECVAENLCKFNKKVARDLDLHDVALSWKSLKKIAR